MTANIYQQCTVVGVYCLYTAVKVKSHILFPTVLKQTSSLAVQEVTEDQSAAPQRPLGD